MVLPPEKTPSTLNFISFIVRILCIFYRKSKGLMMDDPKLIPSANWQTKQRGDNHQEYQIYLACADDGQGNDFTTGKPLKSFDEWINN